MSRRSLTLALSALLVVVLAVLAGTVAVPYVALEPGPTYNTLGSVDGVPLLTVKGRAVAQRSGHINLTTVSVVSRLTLVDALRGWLDSTQAVVPREVVFPPGQSDAQVQQTNTLQMRQSQDSATTAALRQLGVPVTTRVGVSGVAPGSPAAPALRPGDTITTVDGSPVSTSAALRTAVSARAPGATVRIGYRRGQTAGTAVLTTVASNPADGPVHPVIGVTPEDVPNYPFTVSINLKDVGGPSAGLAFALGLVDKLGPTDLTGGRFVAGTGEITDDGTVGPIGGISEKLVGARRAGATVFLVPAANCAEARQSPPAGLQLVRVTSLASALDALATIRAGGRPQGC